MVALEEIELVEPAEIAALEEAAKRLPEGIEHDPAADVYELLARFRGQMYKLWVLQFSSLSAQYLHLRNVAMELRLSGLTPEGTLEVVPHARVVVDKVRTVAHDLVRAATNFNDESRDVVDEMTALAQRMLASAEAILEYCESVLASGNRAFRRSLRKRKLAVSHMPKVPITDAGAKPKR